MQAENVRLVALLESHGIAWRATPAAASQAALTASVPKPAPAPPGPSLYTAAKVALFRRLFRGRTDVYPVRCVGKTSGKSGYAPACANEWRAGVCEKPRIKCGDCRHRLLVPLSDPVIYVHVAGKQTIGVYPLLEDDACHFLAVDFDEAEFESGGWQQDAQAFIQSSSELGVPAALEISRSGQGAHAWVFFAGRVSARDARRLGTAIISHTCARTRLRISVIVDARFSLIVDGRTASSTVRRGGAQVPVSNVAQLSTISLKRRSGKGASGAVLGLN